MGLSLRPFKKALDFGSRVYDQVNPLDNGRSWQTKESTYQGSPIRDVFDANSASDQQKRVQAQMPRYYKDEQRITRRDNVQSVEENPFKRIWAETTEAPRRVGFGLSSTSKTGGDVQDSYLNEQRYTQDNELKAMTKLKDPTVSQSEKQRWYNYLIKSYEGNQQRQADISKEIGMQVKDADPVAMTAALAEMGVDVATLGMGGVVFKGGRVAAKQGTKELSKYLAKNIIKPVIPGAVGGGLGAFTSQGQDTTAKQVAMGAGAGAAFGLALPVALLGGEKLIRGVGKAGKAFDEGMTAKYNPVAQALQDDYKALNQRWQTATPQMRKNIEKAIKLNRDEFDKTNIGSVGGNVLPDAPDSNIIPRTEISDLTDAELYKQINDLKKTVGTQDFDRKLSNALQEELTIRQTGAETRLEAQSRAAGLTRGKVTEVEVPQSDKTYKVYRGSGDGKKVTTLNDMSILGNDKKYYAFDKETASKFGNNVESTDVTFKKPIEITDDTQWRDIAQKSGNKYASPVGLSKAEQEVWMSNINKYLESQGYDGVVIKMTGTETRTLNDVFGSDQVIPLNTKPKVTTKGERLKAEAIANGGEEVSPFLPTPAKSPVKLKNIPEESVTGKELADRYQAMKNAGMSDADIEAELSNLKVIDEGPVKPLPVQEAPKPKVNTKDFVMPERQARPVVDADGQPVKLGSLVEKFYEGKQGNQNIKFAELDMLGKEVTRQLDDEYKAAGTSFSDVARKVQEAANNGAKTLEDAGLTPVEADILRRAQKEMNFARRKASLGGKQVSEGDLGEMYIPRQFEGEYDGNNLLKGFLDKKPGSEFKRTGTMALEDIDNDASVIGEYVTRYSDTKLYQEERIMKAMEKNNPNAPREVVVDASKKLIDLQNRINDLETTIGLGGLGRKRSLSGGKRIDTAAEMSDIGKSIGKQQIEIGETPSGLTNGDRINSVETHNGQTVGDYLGLNQYRDADSFAPSQVARANGDRTALSEMTYERLTKDYNIPEENARAMADSVGRMNPSLPEEVVIGRLASTYKMAAKQQILEQLQNVNIKNKTLRKDVSDLTNQMLREGTIEQKLSAQIVKKTLTATNAIFRKFNVSTAINELSDVSGMFNIYGRKMAGVPDFKLAKEFGLGDLDPAIMPYIKATQEGKSLKSVLSSINSATNLYHYVEAYKAAVMAHSAKNFYKNLEGDALVKQVLKDYRNVALPVDEFTKTFLDNAPLYTQYMSWAARNMQKEGRFMLGKIDSGVMADKAVSQRIARNLYANLPAKTVFWLASNALKGTAILTAFGLNDFTGLTEQDYSGIAEEDKSAFDRTTKITNRSTVLSLLNSAVQSWEKEQLKNDPKYQTPGEYNPYENNDLDQQIMALFTPSPVKNVFGTPDVDNGDLSFRGGAENLRKTGFAENKGGRVQYEAPTDAFNMFKSYVFGPNSTDNAREYSGNTDISTRVRSGDNPLTAIKDMASEQLNFQDRNYNRPLTKDYTDAYKAIDKELKTATLDGGRKYNNVLDDMKKNDPTNYNTYISSMDGDHVSPEFWREVTGGAATKDGDLTIFNSLKERKKQLLEDMTRAGKNGDGKYNVDPLYDLPENQARMVLQQKATATGDDLSLRNTLYKEEWYKDYMDRQSEYYKNKPAGDEKEFKETERVKQWNTYNDTYNTLTGTTGDTLQKEFPLVWQLKQYEYGTDASKAFLNANYDAWKAQSDALDARKLDVINKMREIEGFPAMSIEAYQQATEVADTSGTDDSKYGYGSGGGSKVKSAGTYAVNTKISGASNPKVSVKAPKIGKYKVAGIKAGSKPKVSMKRSLV